MKKFFIATIPGIVALLLYIGYGEFKLYRIGENIPLKTAIEQQLESKTEFYFYKTIFSEGISKFKFDGMQARKPKILALGQSTVLNFRDFFFHPNENLFYNTGRMVLNAKDYKYIASLIRSGQLEKPDLVVLGIDFNLFVKGINADNKLLSERIDLDPVYDFNEHIKALQSIYFKPEYRELPAISVGIGYRGIVGSGYRKDGSFSYLWELEKFLKDSTHIESDIKENLNKKVGIFKSPMLFDEDKKILILEVLKEYKELGIELLLYFPPLSNSLYDYGIKNDMEFNKFFADFISFQNYVKSIGYDIIPFNTPSELNLNDYYMNNSNHPADVIVAKQFSNYCKSPDRKNRYIDKLQIGYLDSLIKSPRTNCLSFMMDTLVFK